jgi:fluoroquinolone transport system permease protein
MQSVRWVRALGALDACSVGRDPLLRSIVLVPLLLAVAVRWLLPEPVARIGPLIGVDLSASYGWLFSYVLLLLPPIICGTVVGFLLLDQRDEQSLRALRVTPLPLWAYLAYRLALPATLGAGMTLIALPLAGLAPESAYILVLAVLLAAPLAPLTALFLGSVAANKVQGFALQKALSILIILPLLAMLLPSPWTLLAFALPTTWPAQLLWQGGTEPLAPLGLPVGGLLYQALLMALLLRRFSTLA